MNPDRRVAKNAFLNTFKTLLINLFPVLTYPYIARVLGVETVGKYTFSASIVSYFFLLAGLGINGYAIREGARIRDDKKAMNRFASEIFAINLYSTVAAYLLLALTVAVSTKLRGYSAIILILSSEIMLNTLSLNWVYNVYEDYVFTTNCSLILQLLSLVGMFLFVRSEEDLLLYAAISVLSRYGYAFITFFYARRYVRLSPVLKPNRKHLKPVFIMFFSMIAATIYISSDVTILGWICGDRKVGLYDTASKTYMIAKNLINAAIAVTIPRMSYLIGNDEREEAQRFGKTIIDVLLMISLPMAVGLCMISRPMVILYAGTAFAEAFRPLQILSVALCFAVAANFYANCILMSLRKEHVIMIAMIISAAVNIGLNFILIPLFAENAAALTTVIAEIIVFTISYVVSNRHLLVRPDRKNLACAVAGCIGIAAVCRLMETFIARPLYLVLADIFVSVLVYALIQVVTGNKVIKGMICAVRAGKKDKKAL